MRRREPLGIELVRKGIVKNVDIENALKYQREHPDKKLGDILYTLNVCDSEVLIKGIGDIVGVKGILLKSRDIKIKLEEYMSIDIAKKNKVLPFEIQDSRIKVCFADTTNTREIETIRLLLLNKGLVMENYITFESEINKILKGLILYQAFFYNLNLNNFSRFAK